MPNKRPTYKANHKTSPAFSYGGRIVCGTSGLGGVWGAIDPDESVQTILYALENGIRAFDTAPSYANAELYLGMALQEWKGERPFISTKAGRKKGATAFDFTLDYSSSSLEQSLHQSLRLLGLEYIDLLFLHEPQLVPLAEMERIIRCLNGFKAQGLVKSIGIGGNPTPGILPFIKKENFDVVSGFLKLDACNLSALETELPILKSECIAYYAASSLHFSLLGNRLDQYIADGPDGTWITQRDIDNALKVKELAACQPIALSSLAQRYLFSIEEADRVVVGARNAKQMKDTIQDWNEGALPEFLFETITDLIIS